MNNLKKEVILLGNKYNPCFLWSDVFVLFSFFEGLPTVLIEAMAFRCPIVATDCPTGVREILGNNENGLLVPQGDSKRIADSIILILEDKALRKRLTENTEKKLKTLR